MVIDFYNAKFNDKKLNKDLPQPIMTVNGNFRTIFNILDLCLELKYDLYKQIIKCNYISLQIENDIKRYYFIKNKEIDGNVLILQCHEDVLMTKKEDILTSGGIAIRSSNGSFYLPDELIKKDAKVSWQFRKLGNGLQSGNNYILILGGAN